MTQSKFLIINLTVYAIIALLNKEPMHCGVDVIFYEDFRYGILGSLTI